MPVNMISADRVTYNHGVREIKVEAKTTRKHGDKRETKAEPKPAELKPVKNYGDAGPTGYRCRARLLHPRLDLINPGKPIFGDCEGVELPNEVSRDKKGLGRVSWVNDQGTLIFDTFVYYPPDVPHHPHPRFLALGVNKGDIQPENGARPHAEVVADMQKIIDKVVATGGLICGHAISNEFDMLRGVNFANCKYRDTQLYSGYRQYAQAILPSLKDLTFGLLKTSIQSVSHSSIVDSRATMKAYYENKDAIDREQANFIKPAPLASLTASPTSSASTDITSSASHANDQSSVSSPPTDTTRTSDSSCRVTSRYPPGDVVALPDIASIGKGRGFDKSTSTYG